MGHVSFPMYMPGQGESVKTAFWALLAAQLARAGADGLPSAVSDGLPLDVLTVAPSLLLTQTCGYPLMHELAGRVRYVATPCYEAPGCDGSDYSSAIMVRKDDPATDIESLAGRRVAFNARHSQSGYNTLRAAIAPFARDGQFFGERIETGAHRDSLRAVAEGRADCCATDSVGLALLADYFPSELAPLRMLAWTESAPGLPFVTSASASGSLVRALQAALISVTRNPASRDVLRPMRMSGIQVLDERQYDRILAQERAAARLGVFDL